MGAGRRTCSRSPVVAVSPGVACEVALDFRPLGARSDNTNLYVIKSDFVQPYGEFNGSVVLRDAETGRARRVRVDGVGVVERHEAIW